jgi:hypothetical protein
MTWAKASSKFPTDVEIEVAQRKGAVALLKKDNLGPTAGPLLGLTPRNARRCNKDGISTYRRRIQVVQREYRRDEAALPPRWCLGWKQDHHQERDTQRLQTGMYIATMCLVLSLLTVTTLNLLQNRQMDCYWSCG